MKHKLAINSAQHGDLVMRKLKSVPHGEAKTLSRKRCILADGEHTGHQHVVESNDAELIQIGERMLLKLTKPATVTHQEHKPITLTPGIWEIGRVQEYDYLKQMARPVQD